MQEKIALNPGTRITGKEEYTIVSVLGRGGYGITYLAQSTIYVGNIPHKVNFAIKEFYMSSCCTRRSDGSVVMIPGAEQDMESCKKDFRIEAEHLMAMNKYQGIVPVNEIIEANDTIYYVMQHLGNQTLLQFINERGGKLDEDLAIRLVQSIGHAIEALHREKMTHLDIKPENVMMVQEETQIRPVLIDFGLSRHYNFMGKVTKKVSAFGVSDGYSPMEQYAGIEEFAPTADVYALAATLFRMLTGHVPARATQVSSDYLKRELEGLTSPQRIYAIIQAMRKSADHRTPTVAEFLAGLNYSKQGGATGSSGSQDTYSVGVGGTETVIIGQGGNGKTGTPFDTRKLLYALGVAALVALVVFVVGQIMGMKSETETVKPPVAGVVPENQPVDSPPPHPDTVRIAKPIEVPESKPQQTQTTATEGSTQTRREVTTVDPPKPQQTSGTVDLGYGTWVGAVKNGKPNGKGTLTYTSDHRVDSRDETETMAAAGDKAEGMMYGGHWSSVTLYSASGSVKASLIPGDI